MTSVTAMPEAPEALEAGNAGERVTTAEAAALLGLSVRSVRRLARALKWPRESVACGGVVVSCYPRTDVVAELVRREGGQAEGVTVPDTCGDGPSGTRPAPDNGADSWPGAGRTTDPGHDRADMAGLPVKLSPEVLAGLEHLRALAALPAEVHALRVELRRGRAVRAFVGGALVGVGLVAALALAGPALVHLAG